MAAKDGVSGFLFKYLRGAAKHHGWGCTRTACELTRLSEISLLPNLAGLLARGECRLKDRKCCVNVLEQPSHLGVTFF